MPKVDVPKAKVEKHTSLPFEDAIQGVSTQKVETPSDVCYVFYLSLHVDFTAFKNGDQPHPVGLM